ncbi:MAG: hypothetical protein AAB971_03110 [Patescibacteria group bacterium]
MAEKGKASDSKPIVDVAHPGKSAPSTNSKSVIVSNRPMLKDPMMVDDSADLQAKPDALIEGASKPPSTKDDDKSSKGKDQSPTATITEIAAIAAADKPAEPVKEAEDDSKADKQDEDTMTDSDEAKEKAVGKAEDKDTAPENQLAIEDSKAAAHDVAVQKLSESKKYFLPINTVEKRRSKHFVILGVVISILLALTWVDIALDASLIKIPGVKPVTHLFSN